MSKRLGNGRTPYWELIVEQLIEQNKLPYASRRRSSTVYLEEYKAIKDGCRHTGKNLLEWLGDLGTKTIEDFRNVLKKHKRYDIIEILKDENEFPPSDKILRNRLECLLGLEKHNRLGEMAEQLEIDTNDYKAEIRKHETQESPVIDTVMELLEEHEPDLTLKDLFEAADLLLLNDLKYKLNDLRKKMIEEKSIKFKSTSIHLKF